MSHSFSSHATSKEFYSFFLGVTHCFLLEHALSRTSSFVTVSVSETKLLLMGGGGTFVMWNENGGPEKSGQ